MAAMVSIHPQVIVIFVVDCGVFHGGFVVVDSSLWCSLWCSMVIFLQPSIGQKFTMKFHF